MVKKFTTLSSNSFAHAFPNLTRISRISAIFQPVFWIARRHGLVLLTASVACRFLTKLSHIPHFSPKLTFHDFMCSRATWAFHHGVPLDHGTWKSVAIWAYIQNVPTTSPSVSQMFQQHLLS